MKEAACVIPQGDFGEGHGGITIRAVFCIRQSATLPLQIVKSPMSAAGLVLRDLEGRDVFLASEDIEEAVPQAVSLMPEHTLRDLSAQDAAGPPGLPLRLLHRAAVTPGVSVAQAIAATGSGLPVPTCGPVTP